MCDIFTEEEFQCFDAWSNVWLKKQGEQKPADKIEPKFKVGDKVKSVIDGFECTIESIDNTCYYGDTTNFNIQDQDAWELVEQKLVIITPKFKDKLLELFQKFRCSIL